MRPAVQRRVTLALSACSGLVVIDFYCRAPDTRGVTARRGLAIVDIRRGLQPHFYVQSVCHTYRVDW